MDIGVWLSQNWFEFFSVVGIVAGLLFTAVSLRSETKTRRVANLIAITANHRDIWKELFQYSNPTRILEKRANLKEQPVTHGERVFVNLVILHTSSVYYAKKDDLVVNLEGMRGDISQFLSLPIPSAVWEDTKTLQNEDLVAFIEDCLRTR